MIRPVTGALVASFACLAAFDANALTLFENTYDEASPWGDCKFECFGNVGAENFSLAAGSTVEALTLEVLKRQGNDDSGVTIQWSVTGDASGLPGTTLVSGVAAPTSTLQPGFLSGYDVLRLTFDVDDFWLDAGDYWLTLQVSMPNSSYTYYWATATNGDALSALSTDGGASWTTPYADSTTGYAFSVQGFESAATVPLPATLPLMASGLLALGWFRRRA